MRIGSIERTNGILIKSNRIWRTYVTGASNQPKPICLEILTDKNGGSTIAIGHDDKPMFVIDVADIKELIDVWVEEK